MTPKNRLPFLFITIISITLSVLCTSCSQLSYTTTSDLPKRDKQHKLDQIMGDKHIKHSSYADIEQKGDAEIKAGNYRTALNIYNSLMSKYSEQEKKRLLAKIEALLSIMKTSDLELVLKSSKNMIPEPMLLYRIGMNYTKQHNNKKAKEILTQFVSKYPDDSRIKDVQNILNEIAQRTFQRNTIGCMLPLSGKYQVFGKQALRGVQMALQDMRALYSGEEIIFIVKDTESKDDKAVAIVQELADAGVAAIAGPMITSEAAAKEAQKYEIPMICMSQKSEVTTTGDYIFSNFITPEMQIKGLVSHAIDILGIKSFAMLSPNDKYGQTFATLFRQAVIQSGGEIVFVEVYRENQTDFSSAIKRLASLEPQQPSDSPVENQPTTAIFIPDSPTMVALILPQLIYYSVKETYLLGTNIWHNSALLKISKEHIRNAIITDGFFAKSRRAETVNFAEAFKNIYGEYPGFIEAIAYDTASILIKTSMDKDITSREALKKALAGNTIHNGVTGETIFELNGNVRKELFFITVENNSFVEISRNN